MDKKIHEHQFQFDFKTKQENFDAKPFIKWAGGKSGLLPSIHSLLPQNTSFNTYYEPFLGGGAVFFSLQPANAVLNDSNHDLIELYQIVRDDVENLIDHLKFHYNEMNYFYMVREQDPATLSPVERAARFIFLNKTCYNGLYRVNSKGKFNVPFGKYSNPLICDPVGLRSASLALSHTTLLNVDFETATSTACADDFVYFDPPYDPINSTSSFTSYTSSGFNSSEQYRLAENVKRLNDIGVKVMISNSDTPLIRDLYSHYQIIEVQAKRAINCKPGGRGKISELLIMNY